MFVNNVLDTAKSAKNTWVISLLKNTRLIKMFSDQDSF